MESQNQDVFDVWNRGILELDETKQKIVKGVVAETVPVSVRFPVEVHGRLSDYVHNQKRSGTPTTMGAITVESVVQRLDALEGKSGTPLTEEKKLLAPSNFTRLSEDFCVIPNLSTPKDREFVDKLVYILSQKVPAAIAAAIPALLAAELLTRIETGEAASFDDSDSRAIEDICKSLVSVAGTEGKHPRHEADRKRAKKKTS